ncbi:MAG TPA: hypothetical protein VMZ22_00945 [Acidimicrobiales bacterium]|nr:hypothetical protein [Acidimicrobiales bacterium]
MARNRVVIETITCDICESELSSAVTKRIVVDKQAWELDLCENDAAAVDRQVAAWVGSARKAIVAPQQPARQTQDEWKYLESLGFTRHRGRKNPAEVAALAARK